MNDYYEVRFRLPSPGRDAADLLAADLGEAGFESFTDDSPEAVEVLTGYIPAALYDADAIAAAAPGVPFESELIPGQDWNAEWEKNYFQPIVVDGRVVVCSSFHTDVPEAPIRITVNPKMAFGTGHHATTVLMMRSILNRTLAGLDVADMGTGTGILGILAAIRGAASVFAVEIDPFAAENAAENIILNLGEGSAVALVCGDAAALEDKKDAFDLLLANINRNIITADLPRYAASVRPGGELTFSGFYVADRPVVAQAAEALGLVAAGCDELDGWSSMTFKKPL